MNDDTEEPHLDEDATAEAEQSAPEKDLDDEQGEGQPEDEQAPEEENSEGTKKSDSQKRRERSKARFEKLKASEEDATRRLESIRQAAAGEVEPLRQHFTDPADYIAAKAAWNSSQTYLKRDETTAREELETVARQRKAETEAVFQEQASTARQVYPDWDQVALTAPISDEVADLILASEKGAEVAYHLGLNRQEAVRISQMPPMEQARAIGRLEAIVSTPKPKTKSSAPPPINPVSGGSVGSRDPDKMSPQDYRKWRMGGGTF